MALQGSSINLQGGGTISVQGSNRNPQPAAGIALFQPALSGIKIQNSTGGIGSVSTPKPAAAPAYTPPATIAAPVTPVPRLAQFDLSSAYSKALQAAQAAVNPVYAAELSRFVSSQNQALSEQQQAGTATKSALDLVLERLQQDNTTAKARTTEDTNTNIGDINATQAFNARNEGLSFDTTNRALNENLGASGMAGSGLGQQQVEGVQQAFRDQSNEEVRQSTNKVAAANTLMSRTFQDLDTAETRTGEDTSTKKAQVDVDLQNFIKEQQLSLENEKATEEVRKQGDILQATTTNQKSQVDQWIASLRGKGYTPQEIALAAQVYG